YLKEGQFDRAVDTLRKVVSIFQEIEAVAEEAASRVNLAYALKSLGQIDEAAQNVHQALSILRKYNLPQDAYGGTPATYEATLLLLEGRPEVSDTEKMMQKVSSLYQQGGAVAVRSFFKSIGIADGVVERLIANLEESDETTLDRPSTLSQAQIDMLVS